MEKQSLWHKTAPAPSFPVLEKDLHTDVAVIGGGIAGLLTAFFLQEVGISVTVLERGRIGCGETGNSTAKITSQHAGKYTLLLKNEGADAVRRYASEAEAAVSGYRDMTEKYHIDCDFCYRPSYLYTCENPAAVEEECRAARIGGIDATCVRETPLPFPVKNALLFPEQAEFHPLRFLYGIAQMLPAFEQTQVTGISGKTLLTDRGTVEAKKIVFACHFPFRNFPGLYFSKMHQSRTSLLALKNTAPIEALFFSADRDGLTLRDYGEFQLLGGASHRTGERYPGGTYQSLRERAEQLFPRAEIAAMWSAQDAISADGLPYIGRYSRLTPDTYVATGFGKWGFSTAYTAARLLTDLLTGRKHPAEALFSPLRFSVHGIPKRLKDTGIAVRGLTSEIFSRPSRKAEDLRPGEGDLVLFRGKKCCVYKDEDGSLYVLPSRCPHLGCELTFHPDEKSWDCPCHGSRFSYDGKRLSGPAESDLPLTRIPGNRS